MNARLVALILTLAALALGLAACGGDDEGEDTGGAAAGTASEFDLSGQELTVGSKEFTEQLILGQITLQMLEEAGATVNDQIGLEGSVAARNALTSGEIDTYWEYTGTAWLTYLNHEEPVSGAEEQFDAVKEEDLETNSIVWTDRAPFNNTYAIAVSPNVPEEVESIETISDLAELVEQSPDQATFCMGEEFSTRSDGFPGLQEAYGFQAPEGNISVVGDAVVYQQVAKGDTCIFGSVFATDGRIPNLDLRLLEDDQEFFPVYNAALNVREDAYSDEIGELFAPVAEALTDEQMQELNAQVDVEGQRPEDVASQFLTDNGFTG